MRGSGALTQRIGASFFIAVYERSIFARPRFDVQNDGLRRVHGESDGLPGLVVDRFGAAQVAPFTSGGIRRPH